MYVNKVNIIDEIKLTSLIADKGMKKEITSIDFKDLQVELIYLALRGNVDINLKDFARNYELSLTVYQNDVGLFDKVTLHINFELVLPNIR